MLTVAAFARGGVWGTVSTRFDGRVARHLRQDLHLYSGTLMPEPPSSFETSFIFGKPSFMRKTVS